MGFFEKVFSNCAKKVLIAFFAVSVCLFANIAQGDPIEDFARAQAFYSQGNYNEAIGILESLLNPLQLQEPEKIVSAYLYLGAAYFLEGNKDSARDQFVRLLTIRPTYEMDTLLFPPDLIAFFAKIKEDLKEKLEAMERQEKELKAAREHLLEEEKKRREEENKIFIVRTKEENEFVVNFLPFGAGQFQNKQFTKGLAFGLAQILGLVINVASYNYAEAFRNERGYYNDFVPAGKGDSDYSKAKEGVVWQYIGLGIFSFAYLISVGDAYYHYEPVIINEEHMNGIEYTRRFGAYGEANKDDGKMISNGINREVGATNTPQSVKQE